MSLDNNRELGFTQTEINSRRYPAEQLTDTEYADDIAVTSNTLKDANILLKIESAAKEIGLCINTDKTENININQNNNMKMKSRVKYLWTCDKANRRFQISMKLY